MSRYRRNYVPGGTYFFTVVTYRRRPFLTEPLARQCLRAAFKKIQEERPFQIVAIVLLPDHLHSIWTLPSGDSNYSLRWQRIKEEFTHNYLSQGGTETVQSASRIRQRQRGVWQKRFWEHTCQDEDDLKHHANYIHWNPKKHRIVSCVGDYPWSSFHRFVEEGEYGPNWGEIDPCPGYDEPEW